MRKALVTGSSGYIGSVLCKMLKEQGYYVVGVDREEPYPPNAVNKYCDKILRLDFSSDLVLKELKVGMSIFHLAANSLLGPSAENPIEYFLNNSVKSLKLIEFAKEDGCPIIFASTAAVYSEMQRNTILPGTRQMARPVKETDLIAPPNNYGMSKLHTEQMMDAICNINDGPWHLHAISFRFFNVIGAYDDVGPSDRTPHIISSLIRAKKYLSSFILNGSDFDTPDGTCIRDYVDVKDVCRAMIHADIKLISTCIRHKKFNLGTGKGYSNLQVIDAFKKVASPWYDGNLIDIRYGERRQGDPPYLVADPSAYIQFANFKYKYSHDLETMIGDAWRYHNGV